MIDDQRDEFATGGAITATEVLYRMEEWEKTSGARMREFLDSQARLLFGYAVAAAYPLRASKRAMKASLGVLSAPKARHLARDDRPRIVAINIDGIG